MKNIRKYLLILLLGLFVGTAWSCSDDKTDEKFTPKDPELTLGDGKTVSVGKTGGSMSVDVKSNLPWRVKSETEWITIGTPESGMSDGTFTFSVAKNKTLAARTGVITAWITNDYEKKLLVVQDPADIEDLVIHFYVKVDGDPDADGLSWGKATVIDSALHRCINGNYVHVAAGTYVPTVGLSGSTAAGNQTFEIAANITMIGGYPADASGEDVQSDSKANPTIFSGLLPNGTHSAHVMCVTAAKDKEWKTSVRGITLRDGAWSSGSSISANGVTIARSYGSGLVVANADATFTDCTIGPNTGSGNIPGAWITADANVTFEHCTIAGNQTDDGNGAGIWNDWSTIVINNCLLTDNSCVGVGGAIYAHDSDSKGRVGRTYVYNSTFLNNRTDGGAASRRGAAVYGRENSETRLVNCTITGCYGANGGAVAAYGTASYSKTKIDIINCTITKNESTFVGVVEQCPYAEVNIYNSIISGNKAAKGGDNVAVTSGNALVAGALPNTLNYSVNGSVVYGDAKTVVDGSTFDPTTMLGALADNGGPTQTILLLGTDNPAKTLGMTSVLLSSLGKTYSPAIGDDIILKDQTGLSRDGKTIMGACVKQ